MTITLEQVKKLHSDGLYSNVMTLVPFMLSLPELTAPLRDDYNIIAKKYQLLLYYGDALYDGESYKRAEVQYGEALKLRKTLAKMKPKYASNKISLTATEVDVKFKLFQCYNKLNDSRQAMAVLESIPPKQRTSKLNMVLGKIYQKYGMERSAITCYKEVLRSSPLALEAATSLIQLGVTLQEVTSLMNGGTPQTTPEWLTQYLKGYSFTALNKHPKALQIFKSLETQTLKDNVKLWSSQAESHYRIGENQNAISCYEKVRLQDKLCLEGMDIFAQVLAEESCKEQLERLAQELMELSENNIEAWIAMSHYCSCTNQTTRAVYFAQKAHMMDVSNVPALMLKASLLSLLNKPQEAVIHFREAIRLSPNELKLYEGLVQCHLSSEKYKEAINVARNAHKTVGANARTLTLCAKAYACESQMQEKAKVMLKKALVHDSCYLPAVYLFSDILMKQEDYEAASQLLTKQLEAEPTSELYRLKGDCLKELGKTDEAMDMYSKSLRLDQDNVKAMDGVQSAEKDSTTDLDMSGIGLHEPRNRSSMEDLDGIGADVQWMD